MEGNRERRESHPIQRQRYQRDRPDRNIRLICAAFRPTASDARAHQGALVGLTSGRTLWIAWPNDSARVVTEKPHLLVPREDAMWWAGVVILVQRRDSLLLFRLTNGQLGAPLLSVHIGYYEELAMVRWATPGETRKWNATLPTLEPPTVRVVSSPP